MGLFVTIVVSLLTVYWVRRPTPKTVTVASPKPTTTASAVPVPILEVGQAKCSTTFVVACGSASPSPSGSVFPSPSTSASPLPSTSGVPSPSPSTPPEASLDCVTKEVYENDSRNRAGFYYLEKRIADASTLVSGTTVTYNVIAKNNGGASASDVQISDTLSTNLNFVDSDADCNYESSTRTLTCTLGSLSAGSQTQRSFRATLVANSTTSIANTAEVFSSNGQRDACSVQLDATGKVVTPTPTAEAPAELPQAGVFEVTVGTVGVGLVLLILGLVGLLLI